MKINTVKAMPARIEAGVPHVSAALNAEETAPTAKIDQKKFGPTLPYLNASWQI
jgi:hypothetical protein